MAFTNVYYKRTTGTPKACYVCYKPTTTCLATANATDFVYSCDTHLTDAGFATRLGEQASAPSAKTPGLSAEAIAEVKADWEERQKRKREKEKEKEKEKEGDKDKDGDKASADSKDKKADDVPKVPGSLPTSGTATPKPTHERYALHRNLFSMRLSEHRKRKQAAEAKKLAPMLPRAPAGSLSPGS